MKGFIKMRKREYWIREVCYEDEEYKIQPNQSGFTVPGDHWIPGLNRRQIVEHMMNEASVPWSTSVPGAYDE